MKLNDSNLFRQQALINGEWLDANNGEVIDVTNPANGDKLVAYPKWALMKPAPLSTPPTALCPPGVRSPPKNAPTFCATGSI